MILSKEIFVGEIKNGQWFWVHPGHWKSWLKTKKDGKYTLRPPTSLKGQRNIGQNNLYWLRNSQLEDVTGYESWKLHAYFMKISGFIKDFTVNGEPIQDRISSTELSESEFSVLFKKQDEMCNEYNRMSEGEPDRVWLTLTTTDPLG